MYHLPSTHLSPNYLKNIDIHYGLAVSLYCFAVLLKQVMAKKLEGGFPGSQEENQKRKQATQSSMGLCLFQDETEVVLNLPQACFSWPSPNCRLNCMPFDT